MEAGLNSMHAGQLRDAISSRLDIVRLPATLLFDYPTIQAIAEHISTSSHTI